MQDNLKKIENLTQQKSSFTWENLMLPLDDLDDRLEKFWAPIEHLHAVVNTQELRAVYKACLPELSAYYTAVGQNKDLYQAIASLDQTRWEEVQFKIQKDTLRDFELSGVTLPTEKKKRFEVIEARLTELKNTFEMHVLDATQACTWHITDENQLAGLPEHALITAREEAEAKDLPGWLLTLEFPCYSAVVTYAKDRSLRETFYKAYVARASDRGPHAGQFDNTPLIEEILALRDEEAKLLGFAQFTELSLATKMADSPRQVIDFLMDLNEKAYPQALKEFEQLQRFANEELQLEEIAPWDIAYVSEKLCQKQYQIAQEELRPYFPLDKVLSGALEIVETLYGITFKKIENAEVWHPDAVCYQLADKHGSLRGFVYIDLFARSDKRGGAWMNSMQTRRRLKDGSIQLPIATLTCNFAKPSLDKVATLSHDEVITFFHELGHCLHHLLTRVDYYSASGINGVEWDAVELPSQFFEHWAWDEQALSRLTNHVDQGCPLPFSLYQKLIASKNFQAAMGLLRQLEFALFDFRIHGSYQPGMTAMILKEVRQLSRVVPTIPDDRFQNSFTHIFAGGYQAGYYSYKWAEILASDAFSRFEEEGIFNAKTGADFLHCILEVGGSIPAKEAFHHFRGREPKVEALLRHTGITGT